MKNKDLTSGLELNNLSDRINYALSVTSINKATLARLISVKPQAIQYLCSSEAQSSRFTFEIAAALGLNRDWLAYGEGKMFVKEKTLQAFASTTQSVPLLNQSNVYDFYLNHKPIDDLVVSEWLPLVTDETGLIAIEIQDNSMQPTFPSGSKIILRKCDTINHHAHSFVFAYLKKFDTFVVRKLLNHGTNQILQPTNSEIFNEIALTSDVELISSVAGCFWYSRI